MVRDNYTHIHYSCINVNRTYTQIIIYIFSIICIRNKGSPVTPFALVRPTDLRVEPERAQRVALYGRLHVIHFLRNVSSTTTTTVRPRVRGIDTLARVHSRRIVFRVRRFSCADYLFTRTIGSFVALPRPPLRRRKSAH